MKAPTPDFPPFTERQRELLQELKSEINNLKALSPLDSKTGFLKIRKRIDELSVKVLRFALKPLPAESRLPGFYLEAHYHKGRLMYVDEEIKMGFGSFHPDLPTWAKDHFISWIQYHRAGLLRHDGRAVLREAGIVGIETGMPGPPIDLEEIERWALIKRRVLEIRGVELEVNDNDDPKNARIKGERKRTRKPSATWEMVIDNLVEEKLLPVQITPQAFKKTLKKHFPEFPWNKV